MQGAKEQVCASSEGDALKKPHIYTVNWNICKIVYIQVTFQMHTVLVRDQKWRSQVKLYHLHYLLQVRGEHAKNGEDQREVNSSAGMNTHTNTHTHSSWTGLEALAAAPAVNVFCSCCSGSH